MSYWFHKRKNIGGINFNLSKSGIGTSFQLFKGFNIGIDAKGRTYLSGGKFGFRYREYLDSSNIQKELDPKKEFLKIIPNKYKQNFLIGILKILFFVFFLPFITCFFVPFTELKETINISDFLVYGLILICWGYGLFYSVKAKQKKYTKNFINYILNEQKDEALNELDKVINLEKNNSLIEQLNKIKKALLNSDLSES